ncbi:MAG TPA: sulfite exporter TauE/SafE family protein [Methanoregula sp.]|nr:sulfite exporter TauE/SafE family protein [Methanoregula sp.]
MLPASEIIIAGLAAVAAGFINALAGGGTLISFPALVALGIPGISANITSTVALCPGYLGGAIAQKKDLTGQGKRLWLLVPAGIIGGIGGGILLLFLSPDIFRILVPFLILLASVLLAVQDRVRAWVEKHAGTGGSKKRGLPGTFLPVSLAAVYGGYFGAGLSVIVLAVLGLFIDDTLTRLSALKQCISLSINGAAAVFFIFSGLVVWPFALIMAAGALAGGALGGSVAGHINPVLLRWTVVVIGLVVGIILLAQM